MRQKIIVGNWKMNVSLSQAKSLVEAIIDGRDPGGSEEVVICPPHVFLGEVSKALEIEPAIRLGAQNCSEHSSGAYTGEVSSSMLKDIGCDYVIIGHSERRQYYREADDEIARKSLAVINQQMRAIVCVGETLEQRERGETRSIVERQCDAVIKETRDFGFERILIAYEPVWAIGTGKTATPEQAQEVHSWIRLRLETVSERAAAECRILYGGSVNGSNAASVLQQPDVDGGLIGGASLKSTEFLKICSAAN